MPLHAFHHGSQLDSWALSHYGPNPQITVLINEYHLQQSQKQSMSAPRQHLVQRAFSARLLSRGHSRLANLVVTVQCANMNELDLTRAFLKRATPFKRGLR